MLGFPPRRPNEGQLSWFLRRILFGAMIWMFIGALFLVYTSGPLLKAFVYKDLDYFSDVQAKSSTTLSSAEFTLKLLNISEPASGSICEHSGEQIPCTQDAQQYLDHLIGDWPIFCEEADPGSNGLIETVCYNIFGQDIGKQLVGAGLAIPSTDAGPEYERSRAFAEQMNWGIWAQP